MCEKKSLPVAVMGLDQAVQWAVSYSLMSDGVEMGFILSEVGGSVGCIFYILVMMALEVGMVLQLCLMS